ncbi:MAG: Hsp33 family molecular chaperone HslO, partial [Proteobacteria bacterium]|nr:Hsp33 family molecular chaperone HslO [Pseudomonadota bacterium]
AMLLGEALTLAALVQSLLKADGRLIVQAQGSGLVSLLVAEIGDDGALRGYARLADGAAEKLANANRIAPSELLGAGNFVMTLERGGDQPAYQGVVPLEGATLAACAENFFRVSEQTDTRIALAVGEVLGGAAPLWRAGGILMQRVAGDAARGDTTEDWSRASILFGTVTDTELIDPDLPADRLLYRLFHEEGVRMGDGSALRDICTCDEERLTKVMQQFPAEELRELVEPDGKLHARCQFCSRAYFIAPEQVIAV